MIQELFGGSNVGIINNGGGGDISKLSTTPSPSSSAAGGGGAAATAAAENLRCPRCDSSNTKFCYYNNYNLTQPRHFCKTCRRYWTKGGALRNVPIGGGCRKNKSAAAISAAVGKSKMKTLFTETALPSSTPPMLWAQDSSSSHILSLLRANQNPNPNPNHIQNCVVSLKEEGGNSVLFGSTHWGSDPLGPTHLPSMGLSSSSYRNLQSTTQGFILGNEAQNSGLQELYQRLRSSTSYYPADQNAPIILGNVASATNSPILESAPVAPADQLGFWSNPPNLSWPTDCTNAAYP